MTARRVRLNPPTGGATGRTCATLASSHRAHGRGRLCGHADGVDGGLSESHPLVARLTAPRRSDQPTSLASSLSFCARNKGHDGEGPGKPRALHFPSSEPFTRLCRGPIGRELEVLSSKCEERACGPAANRDAGEPLDTTDEAPFRRKHEVPVAGGRVVTALKYSAVGKSGMPCSRGIEGRPDRDLQQDAAGWPTRR